MALSNPRDAVPRYIMPDTSAPRYEEILDELQDHRKSEIGSAWYYIRLDTEWGSLCRITRGGDRTFYHEVVNHENHGISEADIRESVKHDLGTFSIPGHYAVSPHIEKKLRALYDAR